MLGLKRVEPGRRWGRAGLVVGAAVAALVGAWFCRGAFLHRAAAQPAAVAPAPLTTPSSTASDYVSRVVAYIHGNQAISRQELGEYLIHRFGADKLPLLLNKRLIDEECQKQGVVVNAAEVDAALAEDLKGMAINQDTFIKTVLARSKKNLYEWKEDVLRPRLQMTRLVQDRLQVSPEDVKKAYESAYGEKVECRLILWPASQEKQALEQYGRLRDSEAAFELAAKSQPRTELAATGGKLKPIGRHTMSADLEAAAFKLQPGQLSTLIKTPEGIVVLRCDRRIPADTATPVEAVKEKLTSEIRAARTQVEMARVFQSLREQAKPELLLRDNPKQLPTTLPPPNQVVAYLHGNRPVTREDLGEFLIARYGSEKVEFLVNRRIIDQECAAKGVAVTEADVDRALDDDVKLLQCKTRDEFAKSLLAKMSKSLFEWREDVIRPRLMLTRLCQGRVRCTDEDVKKAREAYHGERLECRMIVWPPDQASFARTREYPLIRDSEQEFDRKARSQAVPGLAAVGGKVPVFGRHTLGDDNLEIEAFKLQPGETSALIETAQGLVLLKCDRRIPADPTVTLEQVRAQHSEEILNKKVQREMQVVFKELRDKAKPQMILKWFGQPEDLAAESRKIMADVPNLTGPPPR